MITKSQLDTLRYLSIAFLFILTKPESLFELGLGLFFFIGAMFLDWDILFAKNSEVEEC